MSSLENNPFNSADESEVDPFASAKAGATRQDERAAKRHPCSGRAKVLTSSGRSFDGRMFDISMTGTSILLDDRIAFNERCTITVSVYKSGALHHFQVRARFVHASLAGQSGFKHGFEFDSPDSNATKALNGLTYGSASPFG